ncbi:hypothetical protein [Humibacter sp. RRB41]|uniref:hypothetical protein n=1 Tax=Humibacter sp. RRB41 TaxID=2919946 RepID=UPI001FAAA6BD|nr:hypothetical protein [Humibacter sp. RRB41]
MPTPPPGSKKPQDKKPSQAELQREQLLDEDRALADMPELYAPTELRIRERNKVMSILMRLKELEGEDGQVDIDTSKDSPEVRALMDLIADADDFAESIAHDRVEYIEWSRKAEYAQFTAIITRYGRAVGESTSSSN